MTNQQVVLRGLRCALLLTTHMITWTKYSIESNVFVGSTHYLLSLKPDKTIRWYETIYFSLFFTQSHSQARLRDSEAFAHHIHFHLKNYALNLGENGEGSEAFFTLFDLDEGRYMRYVMGWLIFAYYIQERMFWGILHTLWLRLWQIYEVCYGLVDICLLHPWENVLRHSSHSLT